MRRIALSPLRRRSPAPRSSSSPAAPPTRAEKPRYWVELDNAFGLIEGGDLKVAGVRAGKVVDLKLDQETNRALVQVQINDTGFGSLRSDVFCETPPAVADRRVLRRLPAGDLARVAQGGLDDPGHADRVDDRARPRQRRHAPALPRAAADHPVELGAGVAGNAENLNDAIRRANPALRETDKVLKILGEAEQGPRRPGEERRRVVTDLANNRVDVQRWVEEAEGHVGRLGRASRGHRRGLPPAARLPRAAQADDGRPRRPRRRADARAARPQRLGGAAEHVLPPAHPVLERVAAGLPRAGPGGRRGRRGGQEGAAETVSILRQFASGTPELGKNLAIILEHLDSQDHIPQKDPRSPTIPPGRGYTGLEALLAYVYDQVLSVNVYDSTVHILKVSLIPGSHCARATATRSRSRRTRRSPTQCSSTLGPNQPGINYPDPNPTPVAAATASKSGKAEKSSSDAAGPTAASADVITRALREPAAPQPAAQRASGNARARRSRVVSQATQLRLLDYLLSP